MQNCVCKTLKANNMDRFPTMQGNGTPTQLEDHNWTVDSADVFVRSGPNGMNHFAPWGSERTKEIDTTSTSKDE